MASDASKNDTRNTDDRKKITGQQQAQPVVSLLEKYSSLHRGIDEARKECSQQQLEIESIEGDILRLVDVDRIATNDAIQNNFREKEELLQILENLTLTGILEAQESESLAKSNREFIRYKEEKAMRITQDDQNQFLNTSKVFREKIRTLYLRGELFGLKTPVALLSVYKILHSPITPNNKRMSNEANNNNDVDYDDYDNDNTQAFLIDMNLLRKAEINSIYSSDGKDKSVEQENDDGIEDVLEQLRIQKQSNFKRHKALKEYKQKHWKLLKAKLKKEKQKKDLQSQWERLQRDARDMESQTENLIRQTSEAIQLTTRFRNELEGDTQFETSDTNTNHSTKSTKSAQSSPVVGENIMLSTTNDHSKISRRKSISAYNPYARANGRKNSSVAISETTNATRIISPVALSTSPQDLQTNKGSTCNSNRKDSPMVGVRDDQQSSSPTVQEYQQSTMTSTTHRRQHSIRSRRVRSSRHFGESSFRAPCEFLMKVAIGDINDRHNCNTTTENTAKSTHAKRGQKRSGSSMLHDVEDTDDDDDDDISWLNASPFLSSSDRCPS